METVAPYSAVLLAADAVRAHAAMDRVMADPETADDAPETSDESTPPSENIPEPASELDDDDFFMIDENGVRIYNHGPHTRSVTPPPSGDREWEARRREYLRSLELGGVWGWADIPIVPDLAPTTGDIVWSDDDDSSDDEWV